MKQIDFGEIADFRNGLNFSKDSHGKGCLIIGVSDFRDRMTPDDESLEEINVTGIVGEEDYVSKGDILFVRSNGNKKLVGRSLFIDKDIEAVFSGFCIRARLKSTLFDPKFCFYFTKTNTFRSFISASGGTNIQNLNQVILANVKLPYLSIEEQNKIVKVLSDLDSKIELNNKINAELEAMAKLIYDYWFVQFDFPNAKGKPYKTSGGKMVWSEELNREIPHGWEVQELEKCIERIIDHRGKTPSKLGSDWTTDENGIIALSAKIVKGGKLINLEDANKVDNDLYNKWMSVKLKNGDILMTSEAPAGEFYFIHGKTDYCLSQRLFAIRANQEIIIPSYLYFELSKGHGYSQIMGSLSGSTVFGIRQDVLRTIKVLIPDFDLQKKFDQTVLPQLKQIKELDGQNLKLSELRDWLLPMLMNGQVKIKDAGVTKEVKSVKHVSFKPSNPYFYQTQVVAAIVNVSKQNKIIHGEMTLAKYSYLLDKVFKVPTLFNYDRWHLGPYPKEMKKVVNNKKFFKIQDNEVSVVPQKKEYDFQFQQEVEDAVTELASIFNQYKGKERSYQTELLATVCKVVEDIQSTDLKAVRESMKKWPIELKGEKFKNKAEKFGEEETKNALKFITTKRWNKLLIVGNLEKDLAMAAEPEIVYKAKK